MIDATLVTVHGFWSSPKTSDKLDAIWLQNEDLQGLQIHPFSYASPKKPLMPFAATRVPDYDDIAQMLATEYTVALAAANEVAFVTHSQGGLILQRFLTWMLQQGRGRELARIRTIVMLACPNGGSEYLRSIRRVLGFGRHPQAGNLDVLNKQVADTVRTVLQSVVNATGVGDHQCHIPFHVYAGGSDKIVTAASAQGAFPGASVLAGNHSSILDPDAPGNRTAAVVAHHLIADLPGKIDHHAQPDPPTINHGAGGTEGEPADEAGPAVADRWRHTDGGPAVARLNHASSLPSHPGFMLRSEEDKPPSVTVVVVMGCAQPERHKRSGTELRAQFLSFLRSQQISALIRSLTTIEEGLTWTLRPGHGTTLLEAAIVRDPDDDREVPAAYAKLLLPVNGQPGYGNEGAAELALFLEPRGSDGQPRPPVGLSDWHDTLLCALDVPTALAGFLAARLGLTTISDPASLFGVLLRSRGPLTSMIKSDDLQFRHGAQPSNWFYGYLVGDPQGDDACNAARDLLTQLCEYTLQADEYEDTLAAICERSRDPDSPAGADGHVPPLEVEFFERARFEDWHRIALIAALPVLVRNTTGADILIQGYAITVDNEGRLPWEHQVSVQDRDSVGREIQRRIDRQEPGISIWNFLRIPAHGTVHGWFTSAITRVPTGGSPACTIVVRDQLNNMYRKTYPKEESRTY